MYIELVEIWRDAIISSVTHHLNVIRDITPYLIVTTGLYYVPYGSRKNCVPPSHIMASLMIPCRQ